MTRQTVGAAAQLAGDPEIPIPVAFVVVGLLSAGHYSKGIFVILAGTFLDLVYKELSAASAASAPPAE